MANTFKNIKEYQNSLKDDLIDKLRKVFDRLRGDLKKESYKYDDYVLLFFRYNNITQAHNKGIVSFEYVDIHINKIAVAILDMINNLREDDLNFSF